MGDAPAVTRHLLLALVLLGCSAPARGVALNVADADPLRLSRLLVEDLAAYDARVGSHPDVAIALEGIGRGIPWQARPELGECVTVGGTRWLSLDLDAIQATPRPRLTFRHVLWHELRHAQLTCSDRDHSADPRSLMYPTVTAENLEAVP